MASELSKQIAQCFIVAAPLTTDENEFWSVLRDYISLGVGGIMLGIGGRFPLVETDGQTDIKKLKQLAGQVKSYDSSLFLAVDGEGGEIFNIFKNEEIAVLKRPWHYGRLYEQTGNMKEYQHDLNDYCALLRECGINMNFAPVLGQALPDYQGYLSEQGRAYSDIVPTIMTLGGLAIRSMMDYNIIPVAKHFPGYGSITADPHLRLTSRSRDSVPEQFKTAIKDGVPAIMKGHVLTHLDAARPASLSPVVEIYLRSELKFRGVSITDQIFMGAIDEYCEKQGEDLDYSERVIAALEANDMIIQSYPNQASADPAAKNIAGHKYFFDFIKIIAKAVSEGKINESAIAKSYQRIQALKRRFNILA